MKRNSLRLLLAMPLIITATRADDSTITVWASPVAASRDILSSATLNDLEKHDVADALSAIGGVTLDKSGVRNELQVRVRGFDSRQVPVYYDGVPVYVPYDGNLDLSRFLTFGVGALEVSKGYTSLLQGPNQMGGAINITSAPPKKALEGNVGYGQGWSRNDRNVRESNAALGIKSTGGFLQLSATQLKRDFIGLPHGAALAAGENGRRSNSRSDDKKGALRLGWTPGDDRYTLSWSKQDGEKQSPPYAGADPQTPRYWQWPQYDKESLYYQGKTHIADRLTLKSRLYHDVFTNTLLMYNSAAALSKKQAAYSHYDDYSDGAGLQLSLDLRESDSLPFAAHWKKDVHRQKSGKNAVRDRYEDRTWSLATEYQRAVSDSLDIVAGISYDWRGSVEGYRHDSGGGLIRYDNNTQRAFNWQTLVKYYPASGDTFSFSLYDRSRFPTLKERYTTTRPAYSQTSLVNPHLKPERARGVDLSWDREIAAGWRTEASLYYHRIGEAILSKTIDAQTLQNRNSGRVNYRGLDVGLRGTIGDYAELGANYSLIANDVKETGKIIGLPGQTFTGWLNLTPWQGWRVSLSEEARAYSYSDSAGERRAAGFALTHLRLAYSPGYGLSFTTAVTNLFDKKYALTEGYLESGRQYWAGTEYRF